MTRRVPLALLQISRERLRLFAAVAGVGFGVVLIFVQLGFREALFDSAVRFHGTLDYDLAIVSPRTDTIVNTQSFPRTRLFQVAGVDGVADVTPVYMGSARWRDPGDPTASNSIFVFGIDPEEGVPDWAGVDALRERLRFPDTVLFDRDARPEFGDVAGLLAASRRDRGKLTTEINDRRVEIAGLYAFGTSFGIDGSVLTSDLNFLRLFADRAASHLDVGLVRLDPGADPDRVVSRIAARLPADVDVVTRTGFIEREIAYWNGSTPIGYVFGFGVVMGLVVGMVIVYQILFSDVQDSLKEYATLKAMGYTHRYLVGVVMRQAILLGLFGYLPGVLVTLALYRQAGEATNLPMVMTPERAALVLALTLGMCCASALLAIRKLRTADPAEVF